ncbi:unnamed protein product, partial [marine sediment metagenome]
TFSSKISPKQALFSGIPVAIVRQGANYKINLPTFDESGKLVISY